MSVSRYDLLPPNATPLERDISRATSSLVRAGGPVPLIRTAKRTNIPDSVVPWLIYEYGLGEILPYLGNNQRQALEKGVLWQRIRGTPESVRIALSWIGIDGYIEETEGGSYRWAEYQLGLSNGVNGDEIIDNIAGLARISSPVRSRLQRIYAIYDFRALIWDKGKWDDSLWDDHSGVRLRPDWPQLSFGQVHATLVNAGIDFHVYVAHTIVDEILARLIDHFRWDHSRWDEDVDTLNYSSQLTSWSEIAVYARYEGQTWGPFRWWQEKPWPDVNVVVSYKLTSAVGNESTILSTSFASWLFSIATASSSLLSRSVSAVGLQYPATIISGYQLMRITSYAVWYYTTVTASSKMTTEQAFVPVDPETLPRSFHFDASDSSRLVFSNGYPTTMYCRANTGAISSNNDPTSLLTYLSNGINGRPALAWPNTANNIRMSGFFGNYFSELYVVCRFDANPFPNYIAAILSPVGGFYPRVYGEPNTTGFVYPDVSEIYINGNGANRRNNVFPEINQSCIMQIVLNPYQQTYYSSLFEGWQGLFGELIAFNGQLSVPNRNGLLAFLSAKWGIPISL